MDASILPSHNWGLTSIGHQEVHRKTREISRNSSHRLISQKFKRGTSCSKNVKEIFQQLQENQNL
jgi:hypothetical protein